MRQFVRNKVQYIDSGSMSATMIWKVFNNVMQEAIRKYVPCMSLGKMKKKPMWMMNQVLKSIKKKHRLWQRWKEHNNDNLELKYKKTSQ